MTKIQLVRPRKRLKIEAPKMITDGLAVSQNVTLRVDGRVSSRFLEMLHFYMSRRLITLHAVSVEEVDGEE